MRATRPSCQVARRHGRGTRPPGRECDGRDAAGARGRGSWPTAPMIPTWPGGSTVSRPSLGSSHRVRETPPARRPRVVVEEPAQSRPAPATGRLMTESSVDASQVVRMKAGPSQRSTATAIVSEPIPVRRLRTCRQLPGGGGVRHHAGDLRRAVVGYQVTQSDGGLTPRARSCEKASTSSSCARVGNTQSWCRKSSTHARSGRERP